MIFNQKSFSKGILSSNAFNRENIPGYPEAVRDMNNFLIGRTGEAYRRGGTSILERADNPIERIIPFEINDESYVLIFERVVNNLVISSNHEALSDYIAIKVLNLTDFELGISDIDSLTLADFQRAVPVMIYGSGNEVLSVFDSYYRNPSLRFDEGELASSSYTQIGNILIIVNESHPPFAIRKEGNNFVYYRNIMDMVLNGDKEEEVINALSVFPYSFYGYGFQTEYIDKRQKLSGSYFFDGFLILNNNHDKAGLSEKNRDFWQNRAFICSVARQNTEEVIVYGGIFRKFYTSGTGKRRYRAQGELFSSDISQLESVDINSSLVNLYICDWSEKIGWPKTAVIFENRIIYAGNKAYPSKVWFSSQPSVQRVPFGNEVTVTEGTNDMEEIRTERPIYKTVYYDQLDLFNKDQEALGLVAQNTASAGSYFINNPKGVSIYWIIAGEVLYIGTNLGVFYSQGTNAGSASPIPFNTGFPQIDHIPCRRVFPIVIARTLFFVTRDNSVRMLRFGGKRGYEGKNIDSFSKEVIRDTSVLRQIEREVKRSSYEISYPTGAGTDNFSGETVLDLTLDAAKRSYSYLREDTVFSSVSYSLKMNRLFCYQKDEILGNVDENTEYKDRLCLWNFIDIIRDRRRRNLAVVDNVTYANDVYSKKTDKSGEDNKLKNYSVDLFLLNIVADHFLTYKTDEDNEENILDSFLSSDVKYEISFLYRKSVFDQSGVNFPIQTLSWQFYNQASSFVNGLKNIEKGIRWRDGLNLSNYIEVNSWLQGKVDNGYLLSSRVNFNDPTSVDAYNNRLCGVKLTEANKIVLALESNAMDTSISKIEIVKDGVSLFKDVIPNLAASNNNVLYGREAKNLYTSAEITLSQDLAIDSNDEIELVINLIGDVSGDEVIRNTINVTLKQDSSSGNETTEMRDSLLNKYSGEFYISRYQLLLDNVKGMDNGLAAPTYDPASDSRIKPRLFFANNADLTEANIIIEMTEWLNAFNAAIVLSAFNLGVVPRARTQVVEAVPFNVEENVVLERQNYPAFSTDTRLFFDWVKQILFIFRPNRNAISSYVGFTWDEETGVYAWQRGSLGLDDIAYLPNVKYNLPYQFPYLLGVKGRNILINTEGIFNKLQTYIPAGDSYLPNCLDDHLVFEKTGGEIDLSVVRDLLYDLGYLEGENILLSSEYTVYYNGSVGEMDGTLDVQDKERFIVGKKFPSAIVTWPPLMNTRKGSLRGQKYTMNSLYLYILLGSVDSGIIKKGPEFKLNNKPAQILPLAKKAGYIDTVEVYEYYVQTGKSLDPQFQLLVDNPFPLAITGWDINLGVE